MKEIKFCVLDIETTGLDPQCSRILEIGIALLDKNLAAVDTFESMVTDYPTLADVMELKRDVWEMRGTPEEVKNKKLILDMHTKSGLLSDLMTAKYYRTVEDVEEMVGDFFYKNGLRDTGREDGDAEAGHEVHVAGSSLHFDAEFLQKWMPTVMGHFHHRRLDVSGAKVIVDTWMPKHKELRNATLKPMKSHRAMDDCIDTTSELLWYLENVFHLDVNGNDVVPKNAPVESALPLDPTVNEVFHEEK